jgi:hypothetical protein
MYLKSLVNLHPALLEGLNNYKSLTKIILLIYTVFLLL